MTLKKTPNLTPEESVVFKDTVFHVLRRFGFSNNPGDVYEYVLKAPAGALYVSVLHQTIDCRFVEKPGAIRSVMDRGHNSFSGKWGFMGPDILDMFVHDLERLVKNPVENPALQQPWQMIKKAV